MPLRVQTPTPELGEATAESRQIIAAANVEASQIVTDARQRAAEIYQLELSRSVPRLAETRDAYELLASHLRSLNEATHEMLTGAVRDHRAIRRVGGDEGNQANAANRPINQGGAVTDINTKRYSRR